MRNYSQTMGRYQAWRIFIVPGFLLGLALLVFLANLTLIGCDDDDDDDASTPTATATPTATPTPTNTPTVTPTIIHGWGETIKVADYGTHMIMGGNDYGALSVCYLHPDNKVMFASRDQARNWTVDRTVEGSNDVWLLIPYFDTAGTDVDNQGDLHFIWTVQNGQQCPLIDKYRRFEAATQTWTEVQEVIGGTVLNQTVLCVERPLVVADTNPVQRYVTSEMVPFAAAWNYDYGSGFQNFSSLDMSQIHLAVADDQPRWPDLVIGPNDEVFYTCQDYWGENGEHPLNQIGVFKWDRTTNRAVTHEVAYLHTDPNRKPECPGIAVGPDGSVHLVYLLYCRYNDHWGIDEIVYIKRSPAGTWDSAPYTIQKTFPALLQEREHGYRPGIAVNEDGVVMVVWASISEDMVDKVWYAIKRPESSTWDPITQIATSPKQAYQDIVSYGKTFAIAWVEMDDVTEWYGRVMVKEYVP